MHPTSPSSFPHRAYLHALFAFAFAVLAYQVVLTRIFTVVLPYYMVFIGVTLAMAGLAVGAWRVFAYGPDNIPAAEWLHARLARLGWGFAASSVAVLLWFLSIPAFVPPASVSLAIHLSLPLFIVPFTYAGSGMAWLLLRTPVPVHHLYAADLSGAALGCLGVAAALSVLDPVTVTLASACIVLISLSRMHAINRALTLALAMAAFMHGGLYLADKPHLGVGFWQHHQPLFERWNSFSHLRVGEYKSKIPYGRGYGHPPAARVDQLLLNIDGKYLSVISRFDGDIKKFSFLADDVTNIGYHIRPIRKAAVIGVGGGRDLLAGLYFGVDTIVGVEINPAVIEALTTRFAEFNGNLTRRPGVELVHAEGRSWVNQSGFQPDLLQLPMICAFCANDAVGKSLTPNRLFTVEAWREMIESLSPSGMFVTSRYDVNGEYYRLLSLTVQTLKTMGIAQADIGAHVVAVARKRQVSMVVSKAPFSQTELAAIAQIARDKNFQLRFFPNVPMDATTQTILAGKTDDAPRDLPRTMQAPTDDNPSFFNFSYYLVNGLDGGSRGLSAMQQTAAVLILCAALLSAGLLVAIMKRPYRTPTMPTWTPRLYFAAIGLGFMFVELAQMQSLMLLLGEPVYGLSVVLFSLLFFGGIGSAMLHAKQPYARAFPFVLLLALAVTPLATPLLYETYKGASTLIRIAASIALLAPMGWCMGAMLPIGLERCRAQAACYPWFWAISMTASVCGSIAASITIVEYGLTVTHVIGLCFYAVGICLLGRNEKWAAD